MTCIRAKTQQSNLLWVLMVIICMVDLAKTRHSEQGDYSKKNKKTKTNLFLCFFFWTAIFTSWITVNSVPSVLTLWKILLTDSGFMFFPNGSACQPKSHHRLPCGRPLCSPFSNRVFLLVSWKRKKWGHPGMGRQQHVISHKLENKTFDGATGILNHPSGDVHHAGWRRSHCDVATCRSKW